MQIAHILRPDPQEEEQAAELDIIQGSMGVFENIARIIEYGIHAVLQKAEAYLSPEIPAAKSTK